MEKRKADSEVSAEGRLKFQRMANNPIPRPTLTQPLFVDLILDKVFSFVMKPYLEKVESPSKRNQRSSSTATAKIINDFKNFRLVCKFWNQRATSISHQANIFAARLGDKGEGSSPDLSMSHFLEKRRLNIKVPVQCYILNGSVFGVMNFRLLHDFAEVCLPDAVQLKLQAEDFSQFKFRGNTTGRLYLPKLKELLVFSQGLDNPSKYKDGNMFPSFLKAVLGSAKNLEKVELNIRNSFLEKPNPDSRYIAQQLLQLLPLSVKNLKFAILPLECIHLRVMMIRKLALEKLYFSYGYRETSGQPPALPDFLQYQSSTMVDLAIRVREYPFPRLLFTSPSFPQMIKLKRLHLMALPYGVPISFSEIFPQLEVLNIEDFGGHRHHRFWKKEECMRLLSYPGRTESVRELCLPGHIMTATLIKRASQCFPNLQKLSLPHALDPAESLRSIFFYLPHLKELSVTFKLPIEKWDALVDFDHVLSGVLESCCNEIKRTRNFSFVDVDKFRKRAPNAMAPSLLNMTKLKKLELIHYCKAALSDFSAHFVFLRMASLEELRINRSKMSVHFAKRLMEKLKVFETNWEA